MGEALARNLGFLVVFSLVSTIAISSFLFFYVSLNNYFVVPFSEIAQDLKDQSLLPDEYYNGLNDAFEIPSYIPTILDYAWLISFIALVSSLFYSAYHSRREGYFSVFSMITYGIILILFVMSIILKVSDYIYDVFITKALYGLSFSAPFYTFYMSHVGIINLIIIVIAIVLNFVDLDFAKYFSRKDKEMINDEL